MDDILIRGMEMPQTGAERCIVIHGDGRITTFVGAPIDYAKAIPVPEHGRLIDADALLSDVRQNSASYFADDFAHEWVDVAPTVIPASEEET